MEGGRCAPQLAAEPVDVDRHDYLSPPAMRNPAKQIVTSRDGYGDFSKRRACWSAISSPHDAGAPLTCSSTSS
jgi:hypothetical protein